MTAADYWTRWGSLRSRIARRLFLLFVGCALLPLLVLALVSLLEVGSHLDRLSDQRLHQACKAVGMTLAERLSFLEADLRMVASAVRSDGPGALDTLARSSDGRLASRFVDVTILNADHRAVAGLSGAGVTPPPVGTAARRHLGSGATWVTTSGRDDGGHAVLVVCLLDSNDSGRGAVIGEANPAYLWAGDGIQAPSAALSVIGPDGQALFASSAERLPPPALAAAVARHGPSGRFQWKHDGEPYEAGYWTLFMQPSHLASWTVVHSEPQRDARQPLRRFAWTFLLVVLGTFWIVAFLSQRQIRRNLIPIERLREATQRLAAGDFSHRVTIAGDDEFAQLGSAFNLMTATIENHLAVMHTVNRVGIGLSVERDDACLLELVLSGAQAVSHADAAALYLVAEDGRLDLCLAKVTSRSCCQREPAARGVRHPDAPDADRMMPMPPVGGATSAPIVAEDVYAAPGLDFSPLIEFDRRTGYRSQSFVSVPLRNHEDEVIGVLQLVNAVSATTGEVVAFSYDDCRLAESLASQAAVALTKNRLVRDYKGLFDGLTELISTAIDDQSPHTGGHVKRVVALTMLIAEALPRSASPSLRTRAFSDDELYELRIAALLHDCGKLTTPMHLIAKTTKLETIVDRIRLVEARAEAARRQHRIGLLERAVRDVAPGSADATLAAIDADADGFDRQLEHDLARVRACNGGRESMPDEDLDALCAIAARYRWTTIDHRDEALLSDDELYHLGTRAGTLTPEERAIVEGHVVATIRMLERLPYPKRLRNIPAYAGAHHEQVGGNGYPRKIAGDGIPLQGRIIGLADVLEALTAPDRPYRRAMTLPEAMDVLDRMATKGAVDGDLYRLVVRERIHEQYARTHLRAEAPDS